MGLKGFFTTDSNSLVVSHKNDENIMHIRVILKTTKIVALASNPNVNNVPFIIRWREQRIWIGR